MSVPDEGYSKNASCSISTFLFPYYFVFVYILSNMWLPVLP